MIRAVIFDFNGVLADDEELHYELFRDVLAEEGVTLTAERYHSDYLGYDDRGCFGAALRDEAIEFNDARIDRLIARKALLYAAAAEAGLKIFPYAAETIHALADSWPIAICSGALRPEIEFALAKMGARQRVRLIVSAEDTTACKPDPQGYLLTLDQLRQQMNDLQANECVVIEDSLAGVNAAKAAGMKTIGITNTYSQAELDSAGADAVIERLDRLSVAWIQSQFG